jgi:hypothetical protein
MLPTRSIDIVEYLMRYPLTAEMLLRTSAAWERPYTNRTQLKRDLKALVDAGAIGRQEVPAIGMGRNVFLYHLKPRACRMFPGFEALNRRDAVFRGFAEAPWHTLAASSFCAEMERSAGETKGSVRILATLRPRQFSAEVNVRTRRGEDRTSLVPDYTHVVSLAGRPRLFFLEIQNRTPVILPVADQSVSRSFQFKLTRYKAFAPRFREHPFVRRVEETFGCRLDGFQVLIVTTRGQAHLRNLMTATRNPEHDGLFLFSTLNDASRGNVFGSPVWTLASGKRISLLRNATSGMYP